MKEIALAAYADLMKNYWNEKENRFKRDAQGFVDDTLTGQAESIWSNGMVVIALDMLYEATKNEEIAQKIAAQWRVNKTYFTDEQFVTPNLPPNYASDDCGWNAMMYMIFYKYTKDSYILDMTSRLLYNCYEEYKVGSLENGIWYSINPGQPYHHTGTSVFAAGIIHGTLDLYDVTHDRKLYDMAKISYDYIERMMLRNGKKEYPDITVDCDDMLYWSDFLIKNVDGEYVPDAPKGAERPYSIREAGSVSSLEGNMAMAALHGRYYRYTGDEHYRKRAVETVRALHDSVPYDNNGVYVNDRDGWANSTFMKYFVDYALMLPETTERDHDRVYATAKSIYENARTPGGYYGASWSGPAEGEGSRWWVIGTKPEQYMTSGNSTAMIMAAAYLKSLRGK